MKRTIVYWLALGSLVPAIVASGYASPSYTITDLGTLGSSDTRARAINEHGQVVGFSGDHAFLWDASHGMRDLGEGSARGINASGQVVGTRSNRHAFLWLPEPAYGLPSGMNELGTLGGSSSYATSINDLGQIIGRSTYSLDSGWEHAFLWQERLMTDLGTLGGSGSAAYHLNNLGQIVGSSYTSDGYVHACLWQDGSIQDIGVREYGWLSSIAFGITECGDIAGAGRDLMSARDHSFVWFDDQMRDISSLAFGEYTTFDEACAINRNRQVVGYVSGGSQVFAYLWEERKGMIDLNGLIDPALGWHLVEAIDINDAGQIVGYGSLAGERRAYLLNPVPEPSNLAVLLYGTVGIGITAWRRRLAASAQQFRGLLQISHFLQHMPPGCREWPPCHSGARGDIHAPSARNAVTPERHGGRSLH